MGHYINGELIISCFENYKREVIISLWKLCIQRRIDSLTQAFLPCTVLYKKKGIQLVGLKTLDIKICIAGGYRNYESLNYA